LEADVTSEEAVDEPAAGDQVPAADPPRPLRPLRRDAERNRQRILEAAMEVFNERGLEVSLDDVARHAGVGVGTVYRRFPSKEDLAEALFVDRIESVATLAEQAGEATDPWSGLVAFMAKMAEMLAGDVGLRQMLMFAAYGRDGVSYARQRNLPLVARLVERAQESGQLRLDLAPTDIPFLIFMLTDSTQFAREASPDIWRRYLNLMLDGLRPAREGVTPLPVAALLPEQMETIMRQRAPRSR
jgi:AcrR family transcriptional regulator